MAKGRRAADDRASAAVLADVASGGRAAFARRFDACVIGAGPAGITLARRLAAQGLDVALMEAGGFDYAPESQAFYTGESVGQPYIPLDECRLRYLGGTSGHWDGKCRPLEPYDFQADAFDPDSAWPIGKADLADYGPDADAILDLDGPGLIPDLPMVQTEPRFRHVDWRYSPPTRFGDKYRDELVASPRITLGLNANLTDLRLAPGFGAVEAAVFKSYAPGDPGFTVEAGAYALCLGGIENPRMLLNFRSQLPAGIGNGNDHVGRCFAEHPTAFGADLLLARPMPGEHLVLAADPAFLARQKVSNFAIFVEPAHQRKPADIAQALGYTAGCLTPAIMDLVANLRGAPLNCAWGGLEEFSIARDPAAHPYARVAVSIAQTPNPDSRVMLADETDDFGLRRVRLDWQLAPADHATMQAAITAFGAHVAEQDIGRIRLRDWILASPPEFPHPGSRHGSIAGRHHMGTTRMADDPAHGVVDADCRVHGISNLYIGGSSVFSSAGYTKPTYTIIQLALRLGDHLGSLLAS